MIRGSKKVIVELDKDELWAVYICIHNLTVPPRENFYEKKLREEMIELRDKLYCIGKKEYEWVWI